MSSATWRGPGWRVFDAIPTHGRAVRDWISCVVGAHPCPVDTDDAVLVVSELFGNAVTYGPKGGRVLIAYILWPAGVRLVVCDAGDCGHPQVRDVDALAEGGRGLQVVDALSARWGAFRAARAQVVWCDLGEPLPAHAVEAWAWLSALLASATIAPVPALVNGDRCG